MNFFGLIFLAIVIEGIITYVNTFFVGGKVHWQMIAGILLGAGLSVAYGVDVFALAGLNTNVPVIGSILTGILISRGSNYIFDLISKLGGDSKSPAQ